MGAIEDAQESQRRLERARAYPGEYDVDRAEEAHKEALIALGRLFGRGPAYCRCGEELFGPKDKCGQIYCPNCDCLATARDYRGDPL